MIRRSTKIQLLAFVVITLLGVTYVGFNYVGLGQSLIKGKSCTVHADFPDSGGIFTSADVTYRGVSVGKVGELHLLPDGVRVDLVLTSCGAAKVPASASAIVSDRSPVGEQYVNLVPANGNGPYLVNGSVLPMSTNKLPIATQVLLTNLDLLTKSIPTDDLATVITELGNIFNGRGPALQALLDAGSTLLQQATAALDDTVALIKNSQTVLQTQLDEGSALDSWSRSLNLLSATLKQDDPTLRTLLATGPDALTTVQSFVQTNAGDLGVLLANMATTGQIVVRHLAGVEEIFELYPLAVAGGYTVAPGDGTAHFGLVINNNDPPDCEAGYGGTAKRGPNNTGPAAPNVGARCTLPPSSPTGIRGAQNAPGGDPVYTGAAGTVVPRAATTSTSGSTSGSSALPAGSIVVGSLGDASSTVLGDHSWISVLTDGLH